MKVLHYKINNQSGKIIYWGTHKVSGLKEAIFSKFDFVIPDTLKVRSQTSLFIEVDVFIKKDVPNVNKILNTLREIFKEYRRKL